MAERHVKGAWVEIRATVLEAAERAPGIPEDTQRVPLEMRAKGLLQAPTAIGDDAEILTVSGRRLRGTLVAANPAYEHGFGPPITALLPIGGELRALLQAPQAAP